MRVAHPFATIVPADLRATHMPCLVDEDADGLAILGYVARADPVSRSLGGRVLPIFHGPPPRCGVIGPTIRDKPPATRYGPPTESARSIAGPGFP